MIQISPELSRSAGQGAAAIVKSSPFSAKNPARAENVDILKTMWKSGKSITEINDALKGSNIDNRSIRDMVDRLGLEPRQQGGPRGERTWTPEKIERATKLKADGKTYDEIAKEFGVSRGSIAGMFDRM